MHPRNIIALLLTVISLICLVPGLTSDMLSIKIGTTLPLIGEMTLHETTQSILNTVQTLIDNNNKLVAYLIFLFSVIVPVTKAVLLLGILLIKKIPQRVSLHKFLSIIGKWSMADVFVVGVLLAHMATKSDDGIHATLHEGFYYFLAYCLISLLGIQVAKFDFSN